MKIGSLFSGIGGLEMGLCMANPGAEVAWQAERDPYALAVLAKHWPTVKRYTDVREIDETAARVDVICGGFPCQPHSTAGKRRGTSDQRWIWPEFARIVGVLRPAYVFIENVPGLRTSGLRDVLADLARLGFDAEWDLFSAAEVGAPHRRLRLFVLAYANGISGGDKPGRRSRAQGSAETVSGFDGAEQSLADSNRMARPSAEPCGLQRDAAAPKELSGVVECGWPDDYWSVEPDVGRVADGVPARAHRLRLLGNAVVPQQATLAWRTLLERTARKAA